MMKSWTYELGDVLRIERKGQEVLARVNGYEDSLDDTTALYVNLRISDGKRWGERQVKVYKRAILGAIPDWYEKQQAEHEASIKATVDKIWPKITDADKQRAHEFAVNHGYGQDTRSPIERMIDQAVGRNT